MSIQARVVHSAHWLRKLIAVSKQRRRIFGSNRKSARLSSVRVNLQVPERRLPELVQRLCVEAITAWIQYQAQPWPIWLVKSGAISSAAFRSPRRHSCLVARVSALAHHIVCARLKKFEPANGHQVVASGFPVSRMLLRDDDVSGQPSTDPV